MTTITKTLNTQLNQLLNQVIEQEYIDNQTMIELNRLNSFITKIIRIRNFLLEPPFTEKENQ
jgi:predicted PilT family ATPase